ncbi:MAG: Excinuclease subunit domain protein [Alphaproteobacteria bacterium]|nr:Excinuclease subunit domain protein [Alphaproteobacteria bacterium]
MEKSYCVYILTNQSKRVLYIGVPGNLQQRLYQHKNKTASEFTTRYNANILVYFEQTENVESAILREKQLKGWKRQRKIDLITAVNPHWSDLSIELGF